MPGFAYKQSQTAYLLLGATIESADYAFYHGPHGGSQIVIPPMTAFLQT